MFVREFVYAVISSRAAGALPADSEAVVGGSTLLGAAMNAASECVFVDLVVVSSSDPLALEVAAARRFVNRPRDEGRGEFSAGDVVLQMISADDAMDDPGIDAWVVYLPASFPYRTAEHVSAAFELLASSGASSLISVTSGSDSANGAIYIFKLSDFRASGGIPVSSVCRYEMNAHDAHEVLTLAGLEE